MIRDVDDLMTWMVVVIVLGTLFFGGLITILSWVEASPRPSHSVVRVPR